MLTEPSLDMSIDWTAGSVAHWDDLIGQADRSTLLQSWPYAQTMRASQQMGARFGVITVGTETVGLVQIQEIKLGPIHIVALDRGPLWLIPKVSQDHWAAFFTLFAETFPKRLGRFRRVMPEVNKDPTLEQTLHTLGFRRKTPGYQSIWLDLTPDVGVLRRNLKQKWRNRLNVAERSALTVNNDHPDRHIQWLIRHYTEDRRKRRYPGPSPKIVQHLCQFAQPRNEVLLLRALDQDTPVAAILVFRHGHAATYQIGWTSDKGRKLSAHHLLLWHAIDELKTAGTHHFDLGGINPESAEGVTQFKRGLGGKEFELIGLYT